MRKFLSSSYSKTLHNLATFILRICLGAVMIPSHGYYKLTHFAEMQDKFLNFLGMGSQISLGLATFAEFFCSIFVIMGLFTRLALIPLIILLTVIVTKVHHLDIFVTAQLPFVLLAGFCALMLLGPGKISIDGFIFKK